MNMETYTDPQTGVSGLRPGEWRQESFGLWVRPSDFAGFFQRGIPNMTAEQVKTGILPLYGFPKLQDPVGSHKTASFEWDLYHLEGKDSDGDPFIADVALAQTENWAFFLLVAANPTAYAELHEQAFLPALEALTPLYRGEEAAQVAKERVQEYDDLVGYLRSVMKANLKEETDWFSDQMKGIAMPPSQKAVEPAAELIPLPKPDTVALQKADIMACIADRKSRRKFNEESLTLAELSYLLWATQGVRFGQPTGRHYRTVPSAGSRHSFETYLVVQHVEGVQPGIYRYLPFDHQLLFLFTADNLPEKMNDLAYRQPFVGNSAVCFIWSSIPYRMEWRYGFRSERVILMDVGHVCQNLYLAAESLGCGTCGVAAYNQDELDKFLGLDGKDEFVIYLAPVGKIGKTQED